MSYCNKYKKRRFKCVLIKVLCEYSLLHELHETDSVPFYILKKKLIIKAVFTTLKTVSSMSNHEFHETCDSVTSYFMKKTF